MTTPEHACPAMYDDDFGTCARTYATLLIYPVRTDPAAITERLGIEPSSWQRKGRRIADRPRIAEIDGWFLTTKGRIESKDSRRHIDWILDQIEDAAADLASLREEGARIEVCCYWLSAFGEGGPTISPQQLRQLGALDIELWFDIWFHGDDGPDRTTSSGTPGRITHSHQRSTSLDQGSPFV
jgi:hypothetical protein